MPSLLRRVVAECLGTAFLLAAVVGSGIMAQRLAGGNEALALLCNTLPTGAILTVLILTLGPLSGAHFNPAVSLAFALRREMKWTDVAALHRRTNHRRDDRRVGGAPDVRAAGLAVLAARPQRRQGNGSPNSSPRSGCC